MSKEQANQLIRFVCSSSMLKRLLYVFIILVGVSPCYSSVYVLPDNGNTIGEVQYAAAEMGETLSDVGQRFNVGYMEIHQANPNIDPNQPLPEATSIRIPSQFTLPKIRKGIVINLAQYRLYYFPADENVVFTYPVGIGREGWSTPVGKTTVVLKQRNPVWRPSAKLQAEGEKRGHLIPNEFPASRFNPLGKYVLRLGWPTYLIHGSNRIEGIGTRVSAGCIRLLAADIEELFQQVSVGTSVHIVAK